MKKMAHVVGGLETYKKISGTQDFGRDYEIVVTAFVALKLVTSHEIKELYITNNNQLYTYFDDLAVKVVYADGKSQNFLFQMRYSHSQRHITQYNFEAKRGPFSLTSILDSLEKLRFEEQKTCILFVNSRIREPMNLEKYQVKIEKTCEEKFLFNTGSVFSLTFHQGAHFYLFSDQFGVTEMKTAINSMLADMLQCNIFDNFLNFIRDIWLSDFVLTKGDVILKLAELTVSPFIKTVSNSRYNPKCEAFSEIVKNCHLTIIEGDSDTVENIWELGETTKEEFQIARKFSLTVDQRAQALWYMNKVPLIIGIDEWNRHRVKRAVKLLSNMAHLILLGPVEKDFSGLTIFETLADVQNRELLSNFFVVIQKRSKISLKMLLESVPKLASVLKSNDLVKMTQGDYFIGDQVATLPEGYIPRFVTSPPMLTSVGETEMLRFFPKKVNAILGGPGSGKSTLLASLANQCPSDHWCVYVELREHALFLRKKPLFEDILPHFLQEREDFAEIERIFLESDKIFLFLDGLDEIGCVDLVLDYIKYISSKGVKVWVSSRPHLETSIVSVLRVSPIYLQELREEDVCKYLSLGSAPPKLTPLEMSILKQLSSKVDRPLVGPEIYKLFFDLKEQHSGKSLDMYEIAALKTCLSDSTFNKLNEKPIREFLGEIKQVGDDLQIISEVDDEDRAIFTNRSFAEYLASVWILKNLNKIKLLEEDFFATENQNLKFIFDVLLADGDPLQLGVIYQNLAAVQKHTKAGTKGKRTPLHLLCSCNQVDPEILEVLLPEYRIFERDDLFSWNCIDYALRADNLMIIERMLKKYGDSSFFDNLYRRPNIAELATELGYPSLLHSCIRRKSIQKWLLHVAAKSRNENAGSIIDILIKNGFEINARDKNQKTALQIAVEEGNFQLTKHLIHRKANVKILTKQRRTLLHHAVTAKCPNIEIISLLIGEIDIEAADFDGATPLHLACKEGSGEVVRLLLEKGAKIDAVTLYGKSALHFAILHVEIVGCLVYEGASINCRDFQGVTPLHLAAKKGADVVGLLLDRGADVRSVTTGGRSALHYAAAASNSTNVALLVEEGAYVDLQDKDGIAPLHLASENGDYEMVKQLIAFGADVNVLDAKGQTCLHKATEPKLIPLLRDNGIQVDSVDKEGMTALDRALERGNQDIIDSLVEETTSITSPEILARYPKTMNVAHFLLDFEINPNLVYPEGVSWLHTACKNRDRELVELLLAQGGDLQVTTSKKESLLHFAAATPYPNEEVIRLLLEKGCSKESDDSGVTPLHVACRYNNSYNVQALLGAFDVNAFTKNNENALHMVLQVAIPNLEVVKLLLKAEIELHLKNLQGIKPIDVAKGEAAQLVLEAAVLKGDVAMVSASMKKKLVIDFNNEDSLLHFAKKHDLMIKLTTVVARFRKFHGKAFTREILTSYLNNCQKISDSLTEEELHEFCPCELHQSGK